MEQTQGECYACLCLLVIRQQVQDSFGELFQKQAVTPTPTAKGIKALRAYLQDLQFVRNSRTKDKVMNMVYCLMVDAYVERLVIAVFRSVGAKPPKQSEAQQDWILSKVAAEKKAGFDFVG